MGDSLATTSFIHTNNYINSNFNGIKSGTELVHKWYGIKIGYEKIGMKNMV